MNHDFVSNIIAAPFTPMNEMGAIKPSSIPDYAKKLKKDGLMNVKKSIPILDWLPKYKKSYLKMI